MTTEITCTDDQVLFADGEQFDVPDRLHATVLTKQDIVNGEEIREVVLWADRSSIFCPQCGQEVGAVVEDCPLLIDAGAGLGGAVQEWSQQHGCGEWLTVQSVAFGANPSLAAVRSAAAEMIAQLDEEIETERRRVHRRLRRWLREVLAEHAGGVEPEDLVSRSGDEEVWYDTDSQGRLTWSASAADPDPNTVDEWITVTENDLNTAPRQQG